MFSFKNAEEAAIKVKRTSVCLEILNHIIKYLKVNISEDVNVKTQNIFLVDQWGGRGGGIGVGEEASYMRWTDEGWTIELDAEVELKVEKETDEVLGAEGKVSKSQSPGALVRLGSGDGRGGVRGVCPLSPING